MRNKAIDLKAAKEKIRCLLKTIKELFKEYERIIPITKRTDINIKLILSISFHQILISKILFIYFFINNFFKIISPIFKVIKLIIRGAGWRK